MSNFIKKSDINHDLMSLEWDTNYFGVSSAKVNLKGIVDNNEKKRILEYCKNYDFVTISNQSNVKENNHWLGVDTNAFLTDINVQFEKKVQKPVLSDENDCVVHNKLPINEQIINIAKDSFKYSRFFNDKNLTKELAELVYVQWTKNAFEQENKYFVINESKGTVNGYILFSLNEETCTIELIAVKKGAQGKKIGRSLINKLNEFLSIENIDKIKVGTQIDNIIAVRFYQKMNFTYIGCTSIYHLWRK